MKTAQLVLGAATLALGPLVLTACGSSANTQVSTTSTGQELIDLQDAYDRGLITEKEYQKKRQQILKKK